MAVRCYLSESEFSSPSWEPSNCNINDHPICGYSIYCLDSKRVVAEADTVEEAESAIKLARLHGLKAGIGEDDSPFLRKRILLMESDLTAADRQTEILFSCIPTA